MKTNKVFALFAASILVSGCMSDNLVTNASKQLINQVAQQNDVEVDFDPNSEMGRGLPTKMDFERKYGEENCALDAYMEIRDKYIPVSSALKGMLGLSDQDPSKLPGMTARFMGFERGEPDGFSFSPEITNTFFINELKGADGLGNYKIEVTTKGFSCSIKEYMETRID